MPTATPVARRARGGPQDLSPKPGPDQSLSRVRLSRDGKEDAVPGAEACICRGWRRAFANTFHVNRFDADFREWGRGSISNEGILTRIFVLCLISEVRNALHEHEHCVCHLGPRIRRLPTFIVHHLDLRHAMILAAVKLGVSAA